MTELHKCKLCGGKAWPAVNKEDFDTKKLSCARISCGKCNSVDIWAFSLETEHKTYDEVIDLAAQRWNILMKEK